MPGHIRSIKPELLDLECAAELSSDAWRVWVSLFVLADDRGNLRASPRLLAAHIFHDTAKTDVIESALAALAQLPPRYRVTLYRHETELYAHLSGFTDQTSAIGQYEKKLAKGGRVPEPSSPGSTPEPITSTGYATKKRRTEASSGGQKRAAADRGEQRRTAKNSASRAGDLSLSLSGIPIPVPIPDVVAASPSIARVVPSDDGEMRDGRDSQPDPTPPPATARSVLPLLQEAPPLEQNRPDVASASMARPKPGPETRPALKRHAGAEPFLTLTTRRREPNYQTQYVPGKPGLAIIDPDTGREMVLDLHALSPEAVAQRREHGLAKMREAEALVASSPPPASPRAAPPPPKPSPLPAMLDGDPEQIMRELIAKAPHPISLLADRSAVRFASSLVGGSLRVGDVEPTFRAAALKLDQRFEKLTAESSAEDLEALHRFVAGYLARAPSLRRSQSAALPTRSTEVGAKFLEFFVATYRTEKDHDYAVGDDDAIHAEAIGQAIERALVTTPQDRTKAIRRKYALRLIKLWLSDKFAERCGASLKQLARIMGEEPNRFRFDTPERVVTGASQLPADVGERVVERPTPEQFEALAAQLRDLGSGPKEEPCPT